MSRKSKPGIARIAPARSGGPSAIHGCDYQVECAILRTLVMISQAFCAPQKHFSITIEPRVVHEDQVTRWDIQTYPPLNVSEAKANLSKQDLVEFLSRVGETSNLDADLMLIYGRSSTPLLATAVRLRGIAIECGTDHVKFDDLVALEEIADVSTIRDLLGANYRERLARLVFEPLPEAALERELSIHARLLAPEQSDRLIEFLSRRFLKGGASRQKYEIASLVDSIEQTGIKLTRPAEVRLTDLAQPVVAALALLQMAQSGLPECVLTSAVGITTSELQDQLSHCNLASVHDNTWRIRPLEVQLFVQDRANLLCRGLEGLLDYLLIHETEKGIDLQLRNAVNLAQECLLIRPGIALPLFQAAEHIVKNSGDKHLLLEISDLCIRAGQQTDGGDATRRAQARAQALLCGRSWVLQRTGRLPEARMWAEKSLQLGIAIGWDRNTAFAKKCIARLDRLEAQEPEVSTGTRAALLQASADKLLEAIEMFSSSSEFGPTHRQVGDCYCLLARTYLVAGRQDDTSDALQKAYYILPKDRTKEYFDLLLMTGDFQAKWGSREEANRNYTQVIVDHSRERREDSEIYARALSKRGENRAKLRHKQGAIDDYARAVEVWRSLDEYEEAAKVEWARAELEGKIERDTLQRFEKEPSALVRQIALQTYIDKLGATKALARRSSPTDAQIEQYLKEARKRSFLDHPEW